jgi:predicted phage terminase large subunit-like protein
MSRRKDVLEELLEMFEAEAERESLSDPFRFITKVLGYQLKDFHKKWWLFQEREYRSLVLAPRGHGKSTILTISYSIWHLLQNPETRILIVSNTHAQAQVFLREIKRHLEGNPAVKRLYGNLCGSPWSENEINIASRKSLAKESSITAMGMYGPVIARHYDLIILDDVIDEENATSERQRKRALTWYYKELLPCLEPHGKIHVIGTRYHYLDLYGHLLEAEFKDQALISRAIQDVDGKPSALWEEKFSLKLLLKKKEQSGTAIFNSQYQNDVEAMKGSIFKEEWIHLYQVPPLLVAKFQAVDLAISQREHADYFAHVTIGQDENKCLYVLDTFRGRLTFQKQFQKIQQLYHKHNYPESPVVKIGVEANAYQEALAQKLRSETELPVKSVVRHQDKIIRAYRLQAQFENGKILFPERGAEKLIEELLLFPEAQHDDLFDALECAVSMAQTINTYQQILKPMPDFSP